MSQLEFLLDLSDLLFRLFLEIFYRLLDIIRNLFTLHRYKSSENVGLDPNLVELNLRKALLGKNGVEPAQSSVTVTTNEKEKQHTASTPSPTKPLYC